MDKNALKKYAVWARQELISRVTQKALQYGVLDQKNLSVDASIVGGTVLSDCEQKQRRALIEQVNAKGYTQTMEEVAYTWFNRFSALRFMEVNGYLPNHVRVFTDEENNFKPQILTEAIHLEMDGLDMEKVYALKDANGNDALFKYLIIVQCNALSSILPGMFQKIDDYTELLFPDNLLHEGSAIQQMIELIPEEDWKDQVQIIGWLYQYYNTEPKDKVFADLKKNIKISKEKIPAATQLFTPDWIVRYMVENSLGRLWVEGHPNEELKANWKYYLEEAEQERSVQTQLAEIRKEYAALAPEQIKCIDPCMGSGHILAYLFDVLMQIYEVYGYATREAVASIVEHNLYGLDIDDRAAQLAYFAVMMKARQYDRRFFSRGIQPNVYAIRESNHLDKTALDYFCNGDAHLTQAAQTLVKEFHDAKEYGSILNVTPVDFDALYSRCDEVFDEFSLYRDQVLGELLPLFRCAQILAQKYDVVVTNPPYMGNMPVKMTKYVRKNYAVEKYDLYAVMSKKCRCLTVSNGFTAMITQQAWMFLSSFEQFRISLNCISVVSLIQLGARAFEDIGGEVVQTASFVLRNTNIENYIGFYEQLTNGASQEEKERLFLEKKPFFCSQSKFMRIPGNIYAYWMPDRATSLFLDGSLGDYATIKSGIVTGDNDYFLKLWYEIDIMHICFTHKHFIDNSNIRWVPMHKGGGYRKHFGLHHYVMNLHDIWEPSKTNASVRKGEPQYYFKEGLTWSTLSNSLSVRKSPSGFVFDTKGSMCFPPEETIDYLEAFLNSKIASYYMSFLSPTLDFNQGAMAKIPFIFSSDCCKQIKTLSERNVVASKNDWDSFETSWDFQVHPLIKNQKALWDASNVCCTLNAVLGIRAEETKKMSMLEICYHLWEAECKTRFDQLKANEEELNRIFIDIYGLQDELTPEVEDKDVTVRKAELGRDIRSFISYAVGCMFGRYSLDVPGLILAGQPYSARFAINPDGYAYGEPTKLSGTFIRIEDDSAEMRKCSFVPDEDNIIPICDDEYFADDIVGRFVEFVRTVYGPETLEANLKFIADAMGGKGQPRDVIRDYFLNDFYADHLKVYQKRPIYWLFDSGKKNGFKCLVYMHRYQPDTIARIRTDYVHEQQSRYRTAIADLEQRINGASTSERVKLSKQLQKLRDQADEIRIYEEKIHHMADQMIPIDLDDGVKVNYAKFEDVLAKIK